MKCLVLAAFAAALAIPALAQPVPSGHAESIIVQPPARPDLATWAATVDHALDRNLDQPIPGFGDTDEGVVSIRFNCGDDGRPADIVLDHGSGKHMLDSFAMRAVSRIRSLNPLPARVQQGQAIRANIFFANSEESLARQQAAFQRREAARMARGQVPSDHILVLTVTHRADG